VENIFDPAAMTLYISACSSTVDDAKYLWTKEALVPGFGGRSDL